MMMDNINKIMAACLLACLLWACEERVPDLYDAPNGIYFNNRNAASALLDSTVVNEIVEYGTAPEATVNINAAISSVEKNADGSGTLTLADGTTLAFTGVKSMTATAYTAGGSPSYGTENHSFGAVVQ